jgi:hypothetical protein
LNDSEIPPTERIRMLADILSGRLTVQDAARRNGLPVRVVERWLQEIPVATPTDRTARTAGDDTTPAGADPRPSPRCRIVVDEMLQGLGL